MGKTFFGKNHTFNHLFSEKYEYDGEYSIKPKIVLTQYNSSRLNWKELDTNELSFTQYVDNECINWFQVIGLTNTELINRLLTDFDFHVIDAKAILTPSHAAKIDAFDNRLIIVIRPSFFEHKHKISSEHVCILSKKNIVITFKERGKLSLDNVRRALRLNVMHIRDWNRGMLVGFILNSILSAMIGTAIDIEEVLESIDNQLLSEHINHDIGQKIQQCQHANLIIQRNTIPLKAEFSKLLNTDLIKDDTYLCTVFHELYNQLDFVLLTSESSKEILASLRDLYVSNNDLKTNAIVKRLTLVSTLFIPITFLVGLWGMNFELMPEIKWQYGYLFAWGILICTVGLTWWYMKRHKWF